MKEKQLTVSDLSSLIAARADTCAELQLLALEAYEHWRQLESKLHELEHRVAHACDDISEVRLCVAPIHASGLTPLGDEASGCDR